MRKICLPKILHVKHVCALRFSTTSPFQIWNTLLSFSLQGRGPAIMLLWASRWSDRKPAPSFLASAGLPAANTSIMVHFKDSCDITPAKLGRDAPHRLLSADASWLQHTTGSQTHVLGSSVKNVSCSCSGTSSGMLCPCSEVSNWSKQTERLMETDQIWGPKELQKKWEGDWKAKKSYLLSLVQRHRIIGTSSGMLCPRRVDFCQRNNPWKCFKQCPWYALSKLLWLRL